MDSKDLKYVLLGLSTDMKTLTKITDLLEVRVRAVEKYLEKLPEIDEKWMQNQASKGQNHGTI